METVRKIASVSQQERKRAILEELDAAGAEYELRSAPGICNIVVPSGVPGPQLVIGAHWDSVPGSTGANDNASSCSILLRLIRAMKGSGKPVTFVFFDGEERGMLGSRSFLSQPARGSVRAYVNLDVCGCGDRIAIACKGNENSPLFEKITSEENLAKYRAERFRTLPPADDCSFDRAGIPNISISAAYESDFPFFDMVCAVPQNRPACAKHPNIMTTMHNGANDTLGSVRQEALDLVYAFCLDGLGG